MKRGSEREAEAVRLQSHLAPRVFSRSSVGGSHKTGRGIVPFRVWKMLMSSPAALKVLARKERSARDGNRGEVRQFADGSADRLPSVDVIMIPRDLTRYALHRYGYAYATECLNLRLMTGRCV